VPPEKLHEVPEEAEHLGVSTVVARQRSAPGNVLLLRLREEGYGWFSLGLAPLAGVGDRPGAGLHERAVHQVYEPLTAVFSFKGLRTYKAKFEPVCQDRFDTLAIVYWSRSKHAGCCASRPSATQQPRGVEDEQGLGGDVDECSDDGVQESITGPLPTGDIEMAPPLVDRRS
jgi:Phosphatidylglycerol lysyltransferase, C-terminal